MAPPLPAHLLPALPLLHTSPSCPSPFLHLHWQHLTYRSGILPPASLYPPAQHIPPGFSAFLFRRYTHAYLARHVPSLRGVNVQVSRSHYVTRLRFAYI